MTQELEIVISPPPRILSPNGYKHWRVVSASKRDHRRDTSILVRDAMQKAGCNGFTRARLDIDWFMARRAEFYSPLDSTNALASLKAAIDGLVDAGAVPGDQPKYLDVQIPILYRSKKDHAGRCEIVFTLTEIS